jgi:hypothetical protein
MSQVTLQPITMVIPTREAIYAPSRLKQPKVISDTEFLARYADHPRPILVSFEQDGKSNPQTVTAYGYGLDCWYIVAGEIAG